MGPVMKTQPQKAAGGSKAGLVVAGALAAAGAGVWYCHKDMTEEELREAGENYIAKTREVSTAAYEGAKQAAEKTQEASVAAYEGAKPYVVAVGEKTVEVSKDLYAKVMALLFPDGEQETSEETQEVPEPTQYEESVNTQADASELVDYVAFDRQSRATAF